MKAIVFSTLKEAMRKKTFIVMSIVAALFLVLWTILLYFLRDSGITEISDFGAVNSMASIMVTQTGLQFSSMLLCLLTIMLGSGAIATELETGMVHAIISRPIRRSEYVLGKYAGLALLVFVYSAIFFTALFVIAGVFSLSTVTALSFGQVLSGFLFYALVPLAILCLTVFGSVSFRAVPNGLLMIFIYVLGNIGGMVEMIGNLITSRGVISSGIFISLVSPFHTLFSAAERALLPSAGLAGEFMRSAGGLTGSGRPPSVWMYLYICVYLFGFLFLAVRKFGKRDIN